MTDITQHGHAGGADMPRRDFLLLVAGALGAVGAAATIWPFINSMNPSEDVIAAGVPVDIDVSHIEPGQQLLATWRGRPIFIVRRTPAALKILQEQQDLSLLSDPNSGVMQQPPYAQNWHRSVKPEFLVLVGICTHLGCIPKFEPDVGGAMGAGWPGGYFCPCHGSKYDLSGRVFSGVPAPYNLPVPPHHFVNDQTVRVGENPPDIAWDFSSIAQI